MCFSNYTQKYILTFFVFITLFFFAGILDEKQKVYASESITLDQTPKIALQFKEGKLSGEFDNRPLKEVLEEVQTFSSFNFSGSEGFLTHRISGKFIEVPLSEVINEILQPFTYTIISGDDGKIQRLIILGFRDSAPLEFPVASKSAQKKQEFLSLSNGSLKSPSDLNLPEEQRSLFEIANKRIGPPEEFIDQFEPWPDLETEEKGPPNPRGMVVKPLPQFEPTISEMGPRQD